MTQEKPWWNAEQYWYDDFSPNLEKIVAEATRRGRQEASEEYSGVLLLDVPANSVVEWNDFEQNPLGGAYPVSIIAQFNNISHKNQRIRVSVKEVDTPASLSNSQDKDL